MTTVAVRDRPAPARSLPFGWQVSLLFLGVPLWWALGVTAFIWPVLVFPLFIALTMRHRLEFPKGFGLWILFLGWVMLSMTQLHEGDRWAAALYRASIYVSATVLFLYIFTSSEKILPTTA